MDAGRVQERGACVSSRWWSLSVAVALLGAAGLWVGMEWRACRALLVARESSFVEQAGVHFDRSLPVAERRAFLELLMQARRRVSGLYGALRGRPVIAVVQAASLERFGGSTTALTHYQPFGSAVVIGPDGRNVDVVAHELAHAELFERAGYLRMQLCVPTWFDEGLAVHFDNRPIYSEQALRDQQHQGLTAPPLRELTSRRTFFAGSRTQVRHHYALARQTVNHWLSTHPKGELHRFLASSLCTQSALQQITLPH